MYSSAVSLVPPLSAALSSSSLSHSRPPWIYRSRNNGDLLFVEEEKEEEKRVATATEAKPLGKSLRKHITQATSRDRNKSRSLFHLLVEGDDGDVSFCSLAASDNYFLVFLHY